MMWQYTRKDTKVLLVATLMLFSGYALLLGVSWQRTVETDVVLTANTVGVFVGVEANSINLLATQLDERGAELDRREANLAAAYVEQQTDTRTLLLVTLIGVGLLGLILMNFYLDSRRRLSLVQT